MADQVEILEVKEALKPAKPIPVLPEKRQRRLLADRIARRVVTLGGLAIIGSILAIFFVIVAEVLPLLKGAKAQKAAEIPLPTQALMVGVEEYREVAYVVTKDGTLEFVSLEERRPLKSVPLQGLQGREVTASSSPRRGLLILGTSDGSVLPVEITFAVTFPQGIRQIGPAVTEHELVAIDPERRPLRKIAYGGQEGSMVVVAQVGRPLDERGEALRVYAVQETTPLLGPPIKEEFRHDLSAHLGAKVTALSLDSQAENLFVGTASGTLYHFSLVDKANPSLLGATDVTGDQKIPVTALQFVLGDRSLVVGDGAGHVSVWQPFEDGKLVKMHTLKGHRNPVVAIAPSHRDKGFLTADLGGSVLLHHATSEQTLLELQTEGRPIVALAFAPKADGAVWLDQAGTLYHWAIQNPHPEITLKTLFGKVWYEGYREPEYVWQSTGGTDDFEPKFSLTPLAYGTLKGTFYALLFAVPLAVLAAIYTSQFMHPFLRNLVKPTVEIMAALPSVVLGFFAGLWLAPLVERVVPGIFLMGVIIPLMILLAVFAWRKFPQRFRGKVKSGMEILFLLPIIVLGVQLSFWLGGLLEQFLLQGDYRTWLLSTLSLRYDQRNSLVVGFAMGFAVIPLIFTIAEDALSNVPQHLVSGSLALGATRWQTAIRMVLPTASPGIFSAIMIGFGRAVGETMIVLMATGNTPVMNWSLFEGFRALSANIAVELPEAPYGGTLYRVLFFSALLLFLTTFLVNTVAELVRLRLRRRYSQL